MNAVPSMNLSPDVLQVRTQFEHWRKDRSKQARIPDVLWEAALSLVPGHGVSRVSAALRLSHAELKRRALARDLRPAAVQESPASLTFMSLPAMPFGEAAPGVVRLEVRRSNGSILSLTLPDTFALDPSELVSAFMRRPL